MEKVVTKKVTKVTKNKKIMSYAREFFHEILKYIK